MPGRTKAHEGSLGKETAQSCVPWDASGLGMGLVIQARHCSLRWEQWARACLLSSLSFMALLWLKTQMKIGLKECKPELQVWGSQVYSSWASISSSEPALLDLAAGLP